MTQFYLAVPFRAIGVNLLSNPYVVGLPSLPGIAGMITAMELGMEKSNLDVIVNRWAISYFEVNRYQSKAKTSGYMPAHRHKALNPSEEFQPRGYVHAVLYFEIDSECDPGEVALWIENWLPSARFCSGTILRNEFDQMMHATTREELRRIIISIGRGKTHFFLEDKTASLDGDKINSLLERVMRPGKALYNGDTKDETNVVKVIIERLSRTAQDKKTFTSVMGRLLDHWMEIEESIESPFSLESWIQIAGLESGDASHPSAELAHNLLSSMGKNKQEIDAFWSSHIDLIQAGARRYTNRREEDPYEGYLVPTHIGFVSLEKPTAREGLRVLDNGDDPLHCYVEPQIGLARMRAHYSVWSSLKEGSEPAIFFSRSEKITPQHTEFLITACEEHS